jgi:hypothetical protein
MVDHGRQLEAQALPKRRSSLEEDILPFQGSYNNFTLKGSVIILVPDISKPRVP